MLSRTKPSTKHKIERSSSFDNQMIHEANKRINNLIGNSKVNLLSSGSPLQAINNTFDEHKIDNLLKQGKVSSIRKIPVKLKNRNQ